MEHESVYTFIYKTVKSYFPFQAYIEEKLQLNNTRDKISECYLIDKRYFDYWKKFSNYDEIKNLIYKRDYNSARKIITQYRQNNRYRKYQADAIQYIFRSPDELYNALKNEGKSFVLIDNNFWELICTEKGLKESGGMNYLIGKNCITFYFPQNGKCKIITDDNIIDNYKEIFINKDNDNSFINEKSEESELEKIILLYAFEQEIKNKINNITYKENMFKDYFLISKEWILEYKKYYNFDEISRMIQKKKDLRQLLNKGYNEAKRNMRLILKKIVFNQYYLKKEFPEILKNNNTFLSEREEVTINNQSTIYYWKNFEIVNNDLKDLLSNSTVHGYNFLNSSQAKCLISSGKVIVDISDDDYNKDSALEIGIINNSDMIYNDEFIFKYDSDQAKNDHLFYFKNDFLNFQRENLNFGMDLQCELLSNDGNVYGTAYIIPPYD